MSAKSPESEEMRQLVDLLYDGEIDARGMARIEALIMQDQRCVETYVERLDFHCELLEQADQKPAELTALNVLHEFSATCARRENRKQWGSNVLLLSCALLFSAGLGWIYYSTILVPPSVGTIASLSTDLTSRAKPLELGQIVRLRQTISIKEGIVSVQLSDVLLDLVGPATICFDQNSRVTLLGGTVVVKVQPNGIGFTVRTPDAEIVDLGTEFLVQHDRTEGTHVSVRRGAAQAKLLDWRGEPTQILDLTAARAAQFQQAKVVAREVTYAPERYTPVDQSRGGIRRLTGALRTMTALPSRLESDQLTTPNHLLVLPERSIVLDAPLIVEGVNGPVTIPAGSKVSSYLVHYDPTAVVSFAPRGAVTFSGEIAAVVGTHAGLAATDQLFGLADIAFEAGPSRQLELDEDEIRISDDRKTASFFFGVSPPTFLDEVRILVLDTSS